MDNQHKKIKGYRDLSQEEINLMNEIKEKGVELDNLITKVNGVNAEIEAGGVPDRSDPFGWSSVAKTNLQQGIMALTRAVAKPEFF